MPTVLEWSTTVDPSEFVLQVREALAVGSLVVLPGDSGYVTLVNPAAASAAKHLELLAGIAGTPPSVLAYGPEDAKRYVREVPVTARRLMFRAWPAPLVVALIPADV